MRAFLQKGDKVTLACWAVVGDDGKLTFESFDTENEEMFCDGRTVFEDKDGRIYYDYK